MGNLDSFVLHHPASVTPISCAINNKQLLVRFVRESVTARGWRPPGQGPWGGSLVPVSAPPQCHRSRPGHRLRVHSSPPCSSPSPACSLAALRQAAAPGAALNLELAFPVALLADLSWRQGRAETTVSAPALRVEGNTPAQVSPERAGAGALPGSRARSRVRELGAASPAPGSPWPLARSRTRGYGCSSLFPAKPAQAAAAKGKQGLEMCLLPLQPGDGNGDHTASHLPSRTGHSRVPQPGHWEARAAKVGRPQGAESGSPGAACGADVTGPAALTAVGLEDSRAGPAGEHAASSPAP